MKTVSSCYYCRKKWGQCQCTFVGEFTWQDVAIVEPNLSSCGRFFVDPPTYYGCAYIKAFVEGDIKLQPTQP